MIALPGRFDAVDYRAGGEGVGYDDHDRANLGATYRDDAVDIQLSQGSGSAHNIGWIERGEWIAYDVEFEETTAYRFAIRVATTFNCNSFQRFHIDLDGVNVTGSLNVPNTGEWQQWVDVDTEPMRVARGPHTLRIVAEYGGFNLASINVREATSAPETTHKLPGRVEAEDYRAGGEGVGYRDTSTGNHCGAYRADDVDIQLCDDQDATCRNVGWIRDDEWLAFDVEFARVGEYKFVVRTATKLDGRTFHIELNGIDVSGPITMPNTGGWQHWTDVTTPEMTIADGSYTMTLVADTGRFNVNYLDVVPTATFALSHPLIGVTR